MGKKWRNINSYKLEVIFNYGGSKVLEPYLIIFKKSFKEGLKIYFKKDVDLEFSNNPIELKDEETKLTIIPKIADYYELFVEKIESEDIKDINTILFKVGDMIKPIDSKGKIKLLTFKSGW